MSRANVEKFYELLKSDNKIRKQIINVKEKVHQENNKTFNDEYVISQKIIPIARKNHLDFTPEEFIDYTKEQIGALDEDDLLNVSGGLNLAGKAVAGLFSFMSLAGPIAGGLSHSTYAVDPPPIVQTNSVETQTEQANEATNQTQQENIQIAQLQQENEGLKQQIAKIQEELKKSKHVRFGYKVDDEQKLLLQISNQSKEIQDLEEELQEANSKIQELEDEISIDVKSYVKSVKDFAISLNYQANRLVQFLNKVQYISLDDVDENHRPLLISDIKHVGNQIKEAPDGTLYLQGQFRRYSAEDANLDQEDLKMILEFYNEVK